MTQTENKSTAQTPTPGTPCASRVGVIFVRRCGEPATQICARCGIPVCPEHGEPRRERPICLHCRMRAAERDWASTESISSRTSSASTDAGPFAGGGGAFAGAGASETWAQTSTVTEAVDDGESPFSAEDYAAFDALSDYDRTSGVGDGFDS